MWEIWLVEEINLLGSSLDLLLLLYPVMSLGNMRVLCQSRRQGQVVEIGLRSHLHYPHVHI